MVSKKECQLCKEGLEHKIDCVRSDIKELKTSIIRAITVAISIGTLILGVIQYLRW